MYLYSQITSLYGKIFIMFASHGTDAGRKFAWRQHKQTWRRMNVTEREWFRTGEGLWPRLYLKVGFILLHGRGLRVKSMINTVLCKLTIKKYKQLPKPDVIEVNAVEDQRAFFLSSVMTTAAQLTTMMTVFLCCSKRQSTPSLITNPTSAALSLWDTSGCCALLRKAEGNCCGCVG